MSEKDRLIRNMWFASLIVIVIGNLFFTLALDRHWVGYEMLFFSYCTLMGLLTIYIYYRCAYRRPGTKLLTLILYTLPFSILFQGVQVALGNLPFFISGLHPLQLIPTIWLYALSWKLRKINKKLQVI